MYIHLLCLAFIFATVVHECTSLEVDFSQPVLAADYHKIIKEGFATNYFKSEFAVRNRFKYNSKNIEDIYDRGFRNVRLRVRPRIYSTPYEDDIEFTWFLNNLTMVVDDCIRVGVAPIISWENHQAEAYATEEERGYYLNFWRLVAETLKDRNYHLSFNLFTELGVDECKTQCELSLRTNITKYNEWTRAVVNTIRSAGGKNAERILILGAPQKTSVNLTQIDPSIYQNDPYMLVEWHFYAGGPNKNYVFIRKTNRTRESKRFWSGNGTESQRQVLKDFIKEAEDFTNNGGLLGYFGAWMPRDNIQGNLTQDEVVNFARFFVHELKIKNIPWSVNVLDDYYNTTSSEWIIGNQTLPRPPKLNGVRLYMDDVLDNILDVLKN